MEERIKKEAINVSYEMCMDYLTEYGLELPIQPFIIDLAKVLSNHRIELEERFIIARFTSLLLQELKDTREYIE